MRFVLENPPFWTPYASEDAKHEQTVKDEFAKGKAGRWGAGLPSVADSQLLFMS